MDERRRARRLLHGHDPREPAPVKSAQVVALAHELGHHHSHVGNSPRFEVQANAYAARLLIEPDDYAAAERLCEGHAGGMARELGVTTAIIDAWRIGRAA